MDIAERIAAAARPPDDRWRPRLFDLGRPEDREEVTELLADGQIREVRDALDEQLDELFRARNPDKRDDQGARAAFLWGEAGDLPRATYGTWAFYPWSGQLVHLLPRDAFRELRANRNRDKITAAEQARLAGARIGVVGLSVGQSLAVTLALEGVGTRFRLADPDALGLSNLNRLRGRVADLGVPKAALAARQMFELDPWLSVEIFPAGLTEESAGAFFAGGLDLLIEECDDLATKVRAREWARERRIPVLMCTDDRGLLDVERFDREPERPLFHGRVGDLRADALRGLDGAAKARLVRGILGDASERLLASLPQIGERLVSFPQLASEAALAGALGADAARRILLGTLTESGRYYVDFEQLVTDGPRRGGPGGPDRPS